jgi:AbrB family looped-hinge helix DNA binding protein
MAFKTGKLKVDKFGRIVLPKRIRDDLGIHREAELTITPQSDGILVSVIREGSSLTKVDGIWVHRGSLVPGAIWDNVVEDAREERIASVLKPAR